MSAVASSLGRGFVASQTSFSNQDALAHVQAQSHKLGPAYTPKQVGAPEGVSGTCWR